MEVKAPKICPRCREYYSNKKEKCHSISGATYSCHRLAKEDKIPSQRRGIWDVLKPYDGSVRWYLNYTMLPLPEVKKRKPLSCRLGLHGFYSRVYQDKRTGMYLHTIPLHWNGKAKCGGCGKEEQW